MRARRRGRGSRVLLALLVTVGGCPCKSGPPPPPPPPPVYELCLEGSSRLNWYENEAHTLFTRVFQLSSVEGFAQTDPARLLDPQTQVAGAEGPAAERTVYPGAKSTVSITKRPNAEYVGIVAAFYRLDGASKLSLPMTALAGAPCIRLGANGIEPLPVGPQPASPAR